MQKTKGYIFICLTVVLWSLGFSAVATAQATGADSILLLSPDVFMNRVLRWHPTALQAQLLAKQAQAAEQMARGFFDPKLYSQYDQKSFDGKNYYNLSESGIKLPTGMGLEFKGAYLTAGGINLNPEEKLPDAGQAVLGFSASLARGLVIDERRAALRQARLTARLNDAERRRLLNDLAFEAVNTYWSWAAAYTETAILQQAMQLAENRYQAIVESFKQGDKPAVDTLEAFILVQSRRFEWQEARLNYRNAALQLSNYFWDENGAISAVLDSYRPLKPEEFAPQASLAALSDLQSRLPQHPELQAYQIKTAQLEIDRKLAAEQLKPQLDLSYNALGDGARFGGNGDPNGGDLQQLLFQNFKWGARFSMPLLLRKERGKLELVKLKMIETDLAIQQKRQNLQTKLEQYYNEVRNLEQQLSLYSDMTNNYQLLLNAENRKLELGESSIFLINTREQKLIEARLKLAKIQNTLPKYRAAIQWAAGLLVP